MVYSAPASPTLGSKEKKKKLKKRTSISSVIFGAWRGESSKQNGQDESYNQSASASMPSRTCEQEDKIVRADVKQEIGTER